MVTEIKEKEIMTLRQLKEKYSKKWIRYVIVEEADSEYDESDMCYAEYIADTEDEIYGHPYPERNVRICGIDAGDSVVFPMEIGGVYVH